MVKYDPHNHKLYYFRWKEGGSKLPGISEKNADIIRVMLEDMEIGANVNPSSKKGARGYGRLRNLKAKLQTLFALMEDDLGIQCVTDLENRDMDVLRFFKRMRELQLKCRRCPSKPLRAFGTYARIFKTFWHWYMRAQRRQNREVRDITLDVDSRDDKPKFQYFTIDDLRKLCNAANHDYRVMMMFLFDAGCRAPTELMNIRPSDLEWNEAQKYYTLTIREETSKTFGRRIKLLLCSDLLRDYLKEKNFAQDDYIFKRLPQRVNQNLSYLGYKTLGMGDGTERTTKTGKVYVRIKDGLTMYDFRHSSACYWLVRYKSESALKYRFGWKKSEMIHYYTELLGMKDTIVEDDIYTDVTKTDLQQQLEAKGRELAILNEKVASYDSQMQDVMKVLKALQLERIIEQKLVIQTPR